MPITTASRMGVSAVAVAAERERVVLTSHGRTVAVVDSAERIDEALRRLREVAVAALDRAGDLVSERGSRLSLDEVCARAGVDPDTVRARVRERLSHQG